MTKRAFILEEARRHVDTSSAEQFGEIEFLFQPQERRPSIFQVQAFTEAVHSALHRVAFDAANDAFVIVGSVLNVAIAMMALSRYVGDAEVTILMFNARAEQGSEYEVKTLNLGVLSPVS